MEGFEARLSESRQEYEDILQQKDAQMTSLRDMLRDNDTGAVSGQDDATKMMEQKVKDTQDVLSSKLKVIEVLQAESSDKEKLTLEQGTSIKNLTDKLAVTSEQNQILQQNFVEMETQWKEEKEQLCVQLKSSADSHDGAMEERAGQLQQLHSAVQQWEAAYTQVNSQLTTLQTQHTQLQSQLETEKQSADEGRQSHTKLEDTLRDLEAKNKTIQDLEKKLEEINAKASAKFTKLKGQSTAKVKALEKQLEEVQQVCFPCP